MKYLILATTTKQAHEWQAENYVVPIFKPIKINEHYVEMIKITGEVVQFNIATEEKDLHTIAADWIHVLPGVDPELVAKAKVCLASSDYKFIDIHRDPKSFTIKELVTGQVRLKEYRKGNLYYDLYVFVDTFGNAIDIWYGDSTGKDVPGNIFTARFPVPIEDTGDATFKECDKAIYFMRYIRKAQQEGSLIFSSSSPKYSEPMRKRLGFIKE